MPGGAQCDHNGCLGYFEYIPTVGIRQCYAALGVRMKGGDQPLARKFDLSHSLILAVSICEKLPTGSPITEAIDTSNVPADASEQAHRLLGVGAPCNIDHPVHYPLGDRELSLPALHRRAHFLCCGGGRK